MNLLQEFVNSLLNQKPKPSLLTAKNYKADIRQFINWCEEELGSPFDPSRITMQLMQKYKTASSLSENSMKRHLSSLRKFFKFLDSKGIMFPNPLEKKIVSSEDLVKEDPWKIRNFKSFLYEYKKSNLTIKNYINDVKNFFAWLDEAALVKYSWNIADKNLLDKINFSVIEEYKQRLITANFSPATVNRKLSSLRNYIAWAQKQGLIPDSSPCQAEFLPAIGCRLRRLQAGISASQSTISKPACRQEILNQVQNDIKKEYSLFPPARLAQKSLRGINSLFDNLFILPLAQALEAIQYLLWKAAGKKIFHKHVILSDAKNPRISNIQKEFYAPLNISTRYLPTYRKIWHYIRHVRPNWYKQYHSYTFTHYFHFAILTIFSCALGFGIYNFLFVNTQKDNAILGAFTSTPPRVLSFQGKLTDSADSPIIKETSVLFSLYNDEYAPAQAALWQENNSIKPDSNGVFSTFLGKKNPIPEAAFNQSSRLFLGITVGDSPELSPRRELATVRLAGNAQALQGLEPITNSSNVSNVILALDSSGNLSIAGTKAHTFQAIGGNFVLSGKVLSLTTVPGSNGNVEIAPDGIGKIDLSKPIHNSTNNNNLSYAEGSVEFDDTVAILATTSAQSALYINQNSTGQLISASTSGIARFTVENDGTGKFGGNLEINGSNLSSTATTFSLLNSTVATLNIGSAAAALNLGASNGNTTIASNLTLSSLTSNGGVLYTNGSGKIYQASAGSNSDCLVGGTTPLFTSCSKILNQAASVGIGTAAPAFFLDVQSGQSSTAAAQIFNTDTGTAAAGLVIKLGNTSTSAVANTNHFLNFETAGIGIVGSIQGNGTGVQYQTSGIADFAEYFKKDKEQTIEYGSVVCLDSNGLAVKCDTSADLGQGAIIGVASERPAFLGGKNLGDESIAIGLTGQVETFATTINGEIKAGDMLTSSDISGVAVKITKAGQIIGKALENLADIDESKIIGYYDPDSKEYRSKIDLPDIPLKSNIVRVAKIYALVNASWYDPDVYLASTGKIINNNLALQGETLQAKYTIENPLGKIVDRIGAFAKLAAADLKAGYFKAEEIVTQSLIVTSDSVIVNGQNLKDYITQVIQEFPLRQDFGGQAGITFPIVNTDQLAANIISPLGESLVVRLSSPSAEINNPSFIIQNSSGSAVARIDDQGNASFSGMLTSDSLRTTAVDSSRLTVDGNATISGTLRAKNILADSITGLDAKISNIYSTNFADLASYSAQLSYVPDLAAERAQFNQGLMVFGATSLADLSVAERLSIGGTMFITANSIETLGTDLSLQSLRQGGLSIMDGLVMIDTEGNLSVSGNITVNNAVGSSVLSINQTGDVIASGSGTFAKLNFSLVEPVLAVSATEAIASSSAGIANIAPYQSEITIKNGLVTSKSIIYITPVGTPSAQTPFLMRQVPDGTWLRQQGLNSNPSQAGSFTVGVQSPTNHALDFNWLIIN